jgi:hypothetical protein
MSDNQVSEKKVSACVTITDKEANTMRIIKSLLFENQKTFDDFIEVFKDIVSVCEGDCNLCSILPESGNYYYYDKSDISNYCDESEISYYRDKKILKELDLPGYVTCDDSPEYRKFFKDMREILGISEFAPEIIHAIYITYMLHQQPGFSDKDKVSLYNKVYNEIMKINDHSSKLSFRVFFHNGEFLIK